MQSPYDLLTCGEVETYLCAYSAHPFALAAVADVLAGEEPGGTLPVELPGLYPRGHRATWG
jgi:beta-N-acetylhexosaminidase